MPHKTLLACLLLTCALAAQAAPPKPQQAAVATAHPAATVAGLETLAGGGNAGPLEGRLLALGVTRNRMLFNAELFEKCAMAYVLARLGGGAVKKVPWWVRLIAGRRLRQDQARAASSHAAGEQAQELGAY